MKSTEFLQSAMDVQKERGEQYDKPSGERSMGATVLAFNAITGHTLEESDGWMLMGLLKLVRQAQNPEKYHHDSALDFVAYASLYAEAASEKCGQVEDSEASVFGSWVEGNILRYRGESSEFYTPGATYKILAIKGQYMYVEDDSEDNKHGWTLIPAMENFTYYAQ